MILQSKKIAGVILAAGSASRMGKTKQILPYGNTTLLGQVIKNASQSRLYHIIVVLGHDAEQIQQIVDFSSTTIAMNPRYEGGQSMSLIEGLEHVPPDCDGVMFLLGDQPLISPDIMNTLIRAFQTSGALIVLPCFHGKRGNPVIISRSLFHRLKSLSFDTGARVLFDEFQTAILKVPVEDHAVLVDVDTLKDYEHLISN